MFSQVQRVVALHQEVETALRLVQKGLHDLQAVSSANDFYFSALLLLATGVERLEKSIYCLRVLEQSGSFPKPRTGFFAGRKGHNIQGLLDWIMIECYDPVYRAIPAAEQDHNMINTDATLKTIIQVLSDFGQSARYYHLDVVLDDDRGLEDPEVVWQRLELEILKAEPDWRTLLAPGRREDVYGMINRGLVVPIERLIRAFCRLFTLGPLGAEGRRLSGILQPFLTMSDAELGTTRY